MFKLSGFADEIDISFDKQLEAVTEFNLGYIELRAADGINVSDFSAEKLLEVKKKLRDRNVKVSAIGSPIGKIGILEDFDEHLKKYQNVIRAAYELETENIRMFSFYIPDGENPKAHRDEVLRRTESLIDIAKREKLLLLHENEKGIYGDTALRCEDLMNNFYGEHYKAVFDFANFIECGENTQEAYERLRPFIHYVHIKDADAQSRKIVPAGQGGGNIEKILSQMKGSGYEGFLSLEPHLTDFSGLSALQKDVEKKESSLNGKAAFKLALDALHTILERIDQEGKL